ncbi:hypothetical protein [Streptomyces sp. GbtcB6]|uniref:hypothetical protein n=1 Tax=Streptomyces sp. GbtcB6 TaxID=2824751 RepID=UPI001C2F8CA4|nr:hypothetical protein [Streptomyces sp. GbtcB6]
MPTRAQRPRLPETTPGQLAARQAWNEGLAGASRPTDPVTPYEVCTADSCGSQVTGLRPPARGMVQVRNAAEGNGTHWFCPGRCTVLARIRAELRAVPMRPDGDR